MGREEDGGVSVLRTYIHIHTTDDCPDQAGLLAHPTCSDEDGQMV
jgi:hypothetical protein